MTFVFKIIITLALLAFASFCAFGFLASFEPVANALWWRIGYGILAVASIACGAYVMRKQ